MVPRSVPDMLLSIFDGVAHRQLGRVDTMMMHCLCTQRRRQTKADAVQHCSLTKQHAVDKSKPMTKHEPVQFLQHSHLYKMTCPDD